MGTIFTRKPPLFHEGLLDYEFSVNLMSYFSHINVGTDGEFETANASLRSRRLVIQTAHAQSDQTHQSAL